jgi:hypothetical protein
MLGLVLERVNATPSSHSGHWEEFSRRNPIGLIDYKYSFNIMVDELNSIGAFNN